MKFRTIIFIFAIVAILSGCTNEGKKESKLDPMLTNGGPAPHYFDLQLQLDRQNIQLLDSLSLFLTLSNAPKDIAIDSSEIAFTPIGHIDPSKTIPLPEWSHIILKAGEKKQKSLSVTPKDLSLPSGYYQVELQVHLGGSTIGFPSDLFIQYPQGSLRSGKIEANKSVSRSGYTLTVNQITMSEENTVLDINFTPGVLDLYTKLTTDEGQEMREFYPDPKKRKLPMHAQFVFSPIPKSAHSVTFEVTDINKQMPDGIYGVPGHWAITIPLP
jgi:hypothetical protein